MGPINRIDLSKITSVNNLALYLNGMGELRVSEGTNTEGETVTFLRERTLGETIKDFFGINAVSRQRHATAAMELIKNILESHPLAGKDSDENSQFLRNIRKVVLEQHNFTGSAVAAQVQNYINAKKVDPLEGGLVAAPRSKSINLMKVDPMLVVADHAVLRSTTVDRALEKKTDLVETWIRVRNAINPVGIGSYFSKNELKKQFLFIEPRLATPFIRVVVDPTPSTKKKIPIQPDQLKKIYAEALNGKSGTLVLEPFPDKIAASGRATFSIEGMEILMEAISDAVAEAKSNGNELKVTIACEDDDLMEKLNSAYNNS